MCLHALYAVPILIFLFLRHYALYTSQEAETVCSCPGSVLRKWLNITRMISSMCRYNEKVAVTDLNAILHGV